MTKSKKMKKLSIIFYIVFFSLTTATATTNNQKTGKKNTVYIGGTINGKSFNEVGVAINVYDQWLRYMGDWDARNYILDSATENDFFKIEATEKITYVQFHQPTSLSKALRNTWMFVQPGDSIILDIVDGEVSVSGNCADRIRCLWDIFNINTKFYFNDSSDEAKRLKDKNIKGFDTTGITNWEQHYYDQFVQGFEVIDYLYNQKIKTLNRFSERLTKREYDFIALECDVWRKWIYLEDWTEMPIVSDIHRQAKQRFLNNNIARFTVKTANKEFALRSLLLADVIAKNEVIDCYNKKRAYGKNRGAKITFSEVEGAIKRKYNGRLYEKVITAVFSGVKVFGLGDKKNLKSMEMAKNRITNRSFRTIIDNTIGNIGGTIVIKSIPLKDNEDNDIMFSDFRGKLLILDFWFTGCTNCVKLTKAMEPVLDRFKDSTQVAFISVNMDKSKDQWLESLREGIPLIQGYYAHKESINLSCYPLAYEHPLAKALNLQGAPHLILVDEKGDILNRYPPRPTLGNSAKAEQLIKMISDHLRKKS
jgi:thiol-disulfide isomerase/thioredoxin